MDAHDELVRALTAERHTNVWWHKSAPVETSDFPENQARRRAILEGTFPGLDRPVLHVIQDESRAA